MEKTYRLLVDSEETGETLASSLRAARHTIDLQMLTFEGDLVGRRFAEILSRKAREGVRVRVLIDHYTLMVISDVFVFPGYFLSGDIRREYHATNRMIHEMRQNGVRIRITNRLRPFGRNLFHRNHKKMVVVDGNTAFLGGVNLSEHNFSWHDLMVLLSGPVAVRLTNDFETTWQGCPCENIPESDGDSLFLGSSRQLRDTVASLIRNARREIFVESPYAGGWLLNRLAEAASHGVSVSVIVPLHNNFPFFSHLHEYYRRKYARTGLTLRRFCRNGGMTHLKALLIDDTAVLGSSNFSMHFLEESALLSRTPGLISELRRRVFERDIRCSK
jgi:cardiolipin synthase